MAQHGLAVVCRGVAFGALMFLLAGCGGGDGPTQPVIVSGMGAPTAALGADGQYYLDAQGLALYGPKSSGQWPQSAVVLQGADGQDGLNGADGQDGVDGMAGSRILSGHGAPGNTLGSDGDFYLDTASAALYGPKSGGAWPVGGLSLAGSAGSPGLPGLQGPQGPQGSQGPAGGNQFEITWGIFPNTTFGNGSYYLLPQGLNSTLRNPVLLPVPCTLAQLQVATFGVPASGATYTFTVLHTPGPGLAPTNTVSTAMACNINETTRACSSGQTVAYQVGDAIEVQVVGNSAIDQMATPGSWAVGFSCR